MDTVRDKVNEHTKNRRKKILLGIIAVIFVVGGAILLENNINARPTDVTIMKNHITEDKAVFVELKELDTNNAIHNDILKYLKENSQEYQGGHIFPMIRETL